MSDCCGELKANCVCSQYVPGLTNIHEDYAERLAAIGIEESWLSDVDAIEVLAFHKFLNSGRWVQTHMGRMFYTDQRSYDYATGKITSEEYLDQDS